MLKDVYLYMQKIGDKDFPIMNEIHHEFANTCLCDGGLVALAEELSVTVQVSWGDNYRGPVKIRTHAPPMDAAYFDTSSPSKAQLREFSGALSKGIKPEWVDESKTKDYIKTFRRMKTLFAKSGASEKD